MTELNCVTCEGSCCKYLAFPFLYERSTMEFYRARNLRIAKIGNNFYVMIPHRCPKLTENNRCSINDSKPLACKIFKKGSALCTVCFKLGLAEQK